MCAAAPLEDDVAVAVRVGNHDDHGAGGHGVSAVVRASACRRRLGAARPIAALLCMYKYNNVPTYEVRRYEYKVHLHNNAPCGVCLVCVLTSLLPLSLYFFPFYMKLLLLSPFLSTSDRL